MAKEYSSAIASIFFFFLAFLFLNGASICEAQDSVSSIITSAIFDQFLSQRSSAPANGFYTYAAFLAAAAAYSGFGTSGSSDVQKRELAAFFANVAHETGSM